MKKRFCFLLFFLLIIGPGLGQTVYIVDSPGDLGDVDLADNYCADKNGKCTLRAAIENANKSIKKDKVHFNIPGKGPFEIILSKNLPAITEPIELDASTQPFYEPGKPKIVLNGGNIPLITSRFNKDISPIGFYLKGNSGGSKIIGFVIGGFGYTNNVTSRDKINYYPGSGIHIITEKNIIQGNFIGLSVTGSDTFSNIFGITIHASNNLIGGDLPEHRNIISTNWRSGIMLYSNNFIKGNYIGTNAEGNISMGNLSGIMLTYDSENNVIERNLISGNDKGIFLTGDRNYILNNRIGTNPAGTRAVPNQIGVLIYNGIENIIGDGNLISGNVTGITISSSYLETVQANYIYGNLIGTVPAGNKALPNETGIYIHRGNGNIIGGENPNKGNIISGNTGAGIKFSEASENTVVGNIIGANVTGKNALHNTIGIEFSGRSETEYSCDNIIYKNLISGNKKDGVRLDYARGNSVVDNYIGTAIDGITPLPNYGNGINIAHNTSNNCIGSREPGKFNNIAFNKENGIFINTSDSSREMPENNQILKNNIFRNKHSGLLLSKYENLKSEK